MTYQCDYNKRVKVSTFGYLNGITFDQIIEMQQWTDFKISEKNKIEDLMKVYYEQPRYRSTYYSYEIIRGLVCYLDGTVSSGIIILIKIFLYKIFEISLLSNIFVK